MEPKTVYVIPFINEKPNGGSLNDADISNDPIPAEIISDIIKKIQTWINTKFVDYYNEYNTKRKDNTHNFEKLHKNDILHKNLRKNDIIFITKKVIINTELYVEYHATKIDDNKKVEFVVGTIIPKIINSNVEPKVLAFTHGNLINDRRLANNTNAEIFNPFPNNCSAWVEKFDGNDPKGISTYTNSYDVPVINELQGHRGSQVRRELIVTPIDELRNLLTDNFCSLEDGNLRGDINKVWWNYKEGKNKNAPFKWKWTYSEHVEGEENIGPHITREKLAELNAEMIQGGTKKRKARRRTIKRRNNKKTKSSKRKTTKKSTRRHVKKIITRRIKK